MGLHASIYFSKATSAHLQDLVGHGAVAEQRHHALDALVGSFLIVVLGALDGVEEAVPVVGDAFQHIVDPAGRNVVSVSIANTFKLRANELRGERLKGAVRGPVPPVRLPGVLNEQDL